MMKTIDKREYEGKPVVLGIMNPNLELEGVSWQENGEAIINLDSEIVKIPVSQQLNHIGYAFDAIMANVQPGTEYEELIQQESDLYQKALELASEGKHPHIIGYGQLTYYPHLNRLAWQAPRHILHLALLARNEFQLQDPGQKMSWEKQRKLFGSQVVGFLGASVASLVAQKVVQTLKPGSGVILNEGNMVGGIKIADMDVYDFAVWSRRKHGLMEIGVNKAIATVREFHEIDPSLPAWVYPEGVDPYSNAKQFIDGDVSLNEPPVSVVVEAIDQIEDKFAMLKILKKEQVAVWRVADLGSAFQVDYLPFDKYPDFPIVIGVADEVLEQSLEKALAEPSRQNWLEFAMHMTGPYWKSVPEFSDFIYERVRSPFARSIPQLGIAAESAASAATLGISSVLLGWDWPHRLFVDIRQGRIVRDWYDVREGKITQK